MSENVYCKACKTHLDMKAFYPTHVPDLIFEDDHMNPKLIQLFEEKRRDP